MTRTLATPTVRHIRARVPNIRVLHAINPIVVAILRSPLHGLLSRDVLLLRFTGRKTGKRCTVPVGYIRDADTISIISVHGWWKNLVGGAPVDVRLQGRTYTGWAEAIDIPSVVLEEVDRLVARYGLQGAGQRIGVALDISPAPTREEIAQAMRGRVVIRVALKRSEQWRTAGASFSSSPGSGSARSAVVQ